METVMRHMNDTSLRDQNAAENQNTSQYKQNCDFFSEKGNCNKNGSNRIEIAEDSDILRFNFFNTEFIKCIGNGTGKNNSVYNSQITPVINLRDKILSNYFITGKRQDKNGSQKTHPEGDSCGIIVGYNFFGNYSMSDRRKGC